MDHTRVCAGADDELGTGVYGLCHLFTGEYCAGADQHFRQLKGHTPYGLGSNRGPKSDFCCGQSTGDQGTGKGNGITGVLQLDHRDNTGQADAV